MQVLDDDKQRPLAGHPSEDPKHEFQQLRTNAPARPNRGRHIRVEFGEQPREFRSGRAEQELELGDIGLSGKLAQRVHERRKREALDTQLDTLTGEDPPSAPVGSPASSATSRTCQHLPRRR